MWANPPPGGGGFGVSVPHHREVGHLPLEFHDEVVDPCQRDSDGGFDVTERIDARVDAQMDADDLAQLRRLAGVGSLGLLEDYNPGQQQSLAHDEDMSSPLGGKDSMPDSEKRQLEKQNHIKVGSPEWFQLWFSKPWLTGEKPIGDAPAKKIPVNKDNDQR